MRRMVLALLLVFPLIPVRAEAVTLRDIIELTKAGLGENVLLALIEVDGGVFNIDTETLTQLKSAGVSEQVIVALVRSGRTRPVEPPAPEQSAATEVPDPQLQFMQPPQPEIREVVIQVPVAYPVFVPIGRSHRRSVIDDRAVIIQQPTLAQPFPSTQFRVGGPKLTDTPPQPRSKEPVYWGWGGKRRPDAWKEDR
jgi:hypothetical protein